MGGSAAASSLSVVIPVLGDAATLGRLLLQLRSQCPAPAEILVVDGGESQQCRELCERAAVGYSVTRPGRGHQLHHGAARATGDVLWFLHADAVIATDATAAIHAAVRAGAVGGYFRFRFGGPPAWQKSLLATLINLRARVGVPYGDQGLFATRRAYAAAGGFPDWPLFEEVPLVKRLRRAGRFAPLPTAITVSPRRWERDGWLRRTLENRALALAYMAGASPWRLAQRYRGSLVKEPGP